MTAKHNTYSISSEKFCPFLGAPSSAFIPQAAGLTYDDPHYHIQRFAGDHYVFEYVLKGTGYVDINGKIVQFNAGDAYILCPCTYHHYYSDPKKPWDKVWFNGQGDLIAHLMADYQLNGNCYIPGGKGQGKFLLQMLETLEKDPFNCIDELAFLLHQHISSFSKIYNDAASEASRVLLLKHYIEQNLTVQLTMEDIASHVHLSVSRATHLFKEEYGMTPYHYYLSRRLEIAMDLLCSTTISIQEISMQLGFPDYRHFSNLFKRWTGVSPTRFRSDTHNRKMDPVQTYGIQKRLIE